jgi:hypothetical protein
MVYPARDGTSVFTAAASRAGNPTQSFRLLAQACLGVVAAAFVALAISRVAFPPDGRPATVPEGLLPWTLQGVWLKPREKGFYALALILGGICSYLATIRVLPERVTGKYLWPALIVSVPVANAVVSFTLAGASSSMAAFLALAVGGALIASLRARGAPLDTVMWPAEEAQQQGKRFWPYATILVVMTLVLIPSSFETVAARIGLNVHPVSFVIGPALYFLGDGLLPGIDYFTQYSIGYPWLFHFVMGDSAEHAVRAYVVVVIVVSWLFYAHLIQLLQWLYRSWTAAAVAAFIPLILGFVYPSVFPAPFFAPSSSILRYPLLTVSALLIGLWAEAPSAVVRICGAAIVAGMSIFLETETGIIIMLAALLTIFIIHPWRPYIIIPVFIFLAATTVVFLLLVVAAFGLPAFQIEFFQRLFEPFLLYGFSGFGGWPSNWSLGEWNWLYHFAAPGTCIATIAVIARACELDFPDKRRAAVLGFLAASGLLLLAKFTNMSLDAVWQMSSIGPFSVLGWWCVAFIRRIDPRMIVRSDGYVGLPQNAPDRSAARRAPKTFCLRDTVIAAVIVLAFAFVFSPSESRNQGRYGLRAWANYPSLLRWPLPRLKGCLQMDCVTGRPTRSDVQLIESRTRPGEQVPIVVDLYDWAYLLAAQRPPAMFFLPSGDTFTHQQVEESLRRINGAEYLFVPKLPNGQPDIPREEFRTAIGPLLGTTFQKDGEGERLTAWKRVTSQNLDAK